MKHFINLNENETHLTSNNDDMNYNFLICSTLIKRYCSKNFDKLQNINLNEYFEKLFQTTFKIHKKIMKKVSLNGDNEQLNQILSDRHIEFLKLYSINLSKLTNYNFEIKNLKICLNLLKYILNVNDVSPLHSNNEYYLKLVKTFLICINSIDIENFKVILNKFDETVSQKIAI